MKASVDANGVGTAATILPKVYPVDLSADSRGTVYYLLLNDDGLYKI